MVMERSSLFHLTRTMNVVPPSQKMQYYFYFLELIVENSLVISAVRIEAKTLKFKPTVMLSYWYSYLSPILFRASSKK